MSEWELLCEVARPQPDSRRVEELLSGEVDWPRFLELSHRHGLASFTAMKLLSLQPDAVPREIREELRVHRLTNTARQVHAEVQLARLADAFRNRGIPLLSFKGPGLVRTLYGDASLREYGDLDILVRPEDVRRTRDFLVELGYETEFTGEDPVTAPVTRYHKEITFYRDGSLPVDLHWDLSSDLVFSPLKTGEVWKRTASLEIGGGSAQTFGIEDYLVYLCFHGGKHFWGTLSQVCDVAWMIAGGNDFDWKRTLGLAQLPHFSG